MNRIITFVVSLLTLVGLDYIWLGVVIQSKIQKRLGPLMREGILYGPALAFYVLYTGAIVYFAILPAVQQNSRRLAVLNGAILGFTAYMTYDMTNRATLKGRPVEMVARDIVWGSLVTAVVAGVGFWVMNKGVV